MLRAVCVAGTAALLLGSVTFARAAAQDAVATPNANAILARVKAGLRAHERPPYVVYTLVRHDTLDHVPDLLNSYTLRIWCRTADSAALARRVVGSRTTGAVAFITPAFDRPIDPGPPTADLLDVIRETHGPPTPAPDPNAPRIIGSVSVVIETNYHVTYAGVDGADDHLRLEARRDPERNRLTDLYVDRASSVLHRAIARDHLYAEGRTIPERFEMVFGLHDGVPVISAIHGQTDDAALDPRDAGVAFNEVDYRFEDIEFPPDLPAWYFDPAHYGAHRGEYPVLAP
jgi:hypothetical protein